MKKLFLLACISALALAQQVIPPEEVQIDSDSQQRDGSIHHLSGHVVIKTNAVTIRTEKADYNVDTNAISIHGEATIELK
jgi:lipopolysaccharide export system protein LptA